MRTSQRQPPLAGVYAAKHHGLKEEHAPETVAGPSPRANPISTSTHLAMVRHLLRHDARHAPASAVDGNFPLHSGRGAAPRQRGRVKREEYWMWRRGIGFAGDGAPFGGEQGSGWRT